MYKVPNTIISIVSKDKMTSGTAKQIGRVKADKVNKTIREATRTDGLQLANG